MIIVAQYHLLFDLSPIEPLFDLECSRRVNGLCCQRTTIIPIIPQGDS